MNLAGLDDFVTVIRHGGFSKAARATGRPKPTLSRRVRGLEEEMGVRLLDRGGASIRLTDEGLLLYEKADGLLRQLGDLVETVGMGGRELQGRLRISAPTLFATAFLAKIAAEFTKEHPKITVEVVADDRLLDPMADQLDALIRINPRPEGEMVGRCFARDDWVLVATPETQQPSAEEEQEIPGVVFSNEARDIVWKYRDGEKQRRVNIRPSLRVSSMLMVRAAVLAGAGAAILPRSMALRHLESGTLKLWGVPDRPSTEIWVLHSSRRLESARLRAFIRFLEGCFPGGKLPGD